MDEKKCMLLRDSVQISLDVRARIKHVEEKLHKIRLGKEIHGLGKKQDSLISEEEHYRIVLGELKDIMKASVVKEIPYYLQKADSIIEYLLGNATHSPEDRAVCCEEVETDPGLRPSDIEDDAGDFAEAFGPTAQTLILVKEASDYGTVLCKNPLRCRSEGIANDDGWEDFASMQKACKTKRAPVQALGTDIKRLVIRKSSRPRRN